MARRVKKFNSEDNLHSQVANYIRLQYPNVLFRTDFAAGMQMTIGQATKHKSLQAGRAWPDIFIAVPVYRDHQVDYYGLFIEIKKDGIQLKRTVDARKILKGESFLRVAGSWWDEHTEEQAAVLKELSLNGYFATFGVGFDEIKQILDDYLSGRPLAQMSLEPSVVSKQQMAEVF